MFSCSIIQSKTGRTVYETNQYIENLVKFLETNIRCYFEEMVADFIKDESGLWWMIGVRAYKFPSYDVKPYLKLFIEDFEEEESSSKKEKGSKTLKDKIKICRMCQLGYPINELSQRMTLKMIITTESQLKSLGIRRTWLDHGELNQYDLHTLYESRRVCNQCFALYKQVRELNKVAKTFSKVLGIPVDSKNEAHTKQLQKDSHGNDMIDSSSKHEKAKDIDIDDFVKAQVSKQKEEEEAIMQIEHLHRFKLLFIIYDLIEFSKVPEALDGYHLVYSLMGEKTKMKLATRRTFKAGVPIVPINKLRLHYFFSDYRKDLMNYINNGPLVVKLYNKSELISKVSLDIKDFRSPHVNQKSYYSAMVGNDVSCYIRCMVGIEMDTPEAINVTGIKLTHHRGVYLPPKDYMS